MEAATIFYYFGIAFFTLWFIFLGVLIAAGFFMIRSVKQVRDRAMETIEDKSKLASLLPMLALGAFQFRQWWKKFRS